MKYTKQIGRQLLRLLPQAKAIAVDINGECYWWIDIPFLTKKCTVFLSSYGVAGYLGQFDLPKDWKKTLVVKKEKKK